MVIFLFYFVTFNWRAVYRESLMMLEMLPVSSCLSAQGQFLPVFSSIFFFPSLLFHKECRGIWRSRKICLVVENEE